MTSSFRAGDLPKYVWAVDLKGRAYEAKLEQGSRNYHGYKLGNNDAMQQLVTKEWNQRCPPC